MRLLTVIILVVVLVCGCSAWSEKRSTTPTSFGAGTVTTVAFARSSFQLDITNQSQESPTIHITVRIDSEQVVAENFDAGGGHNVESFPFALTAGSHRVDVVADDGTTLSTTVVIPAEGRLYGQVSYWEAGEEPAPYFDFQLQSLPFLYN